MVLPPPVVLVPVVDGLVVGLKKKNSVACILHTSRLTYAGVVDVAGVVVGVVGVVVGVGAPVVEGVLVGDVVPPPPVVLGVLEGPPGELEGSFPTQLESAVSCLDEPERFLQAT